MRCKNCDYPLWNMPSRTCPECGTGFRPSEFDFVVNSVRFVCPHCSQAYYGTGPRGHLVPGSFDCVRCRTFIRMDDMILLPSEGVREEQTRTVINPWTEPREPGIWRFVRAWFRTIGLGIALPADLIRGTPPSSSAGKAILFAFLTNTTFVLISMSPLLLIGFLGPGGFGGPATPGAAASMLMSIGAFVAGAAAFGLFSVLLWSAVAHGLLRMTGPVEHPYRRTVQAIAYSSGTNVLMAVPCLGMYIVGWAGAIWWIAVASVMVCIGQKVKGWRAALAVAGPPVTAFLVIVALWVAFIFVAVSSVPATFPAPPPPPPPPPGALATGPSGGATNWVGAQALASTTAASAGRRLVEWAEERGGEGPRHAAELLRDDRLTGSELAQRPDGSMGDASIGRYSATDFELLDESIQDPVIDGLAAAMPPDVTAHRVGWLVFLHHGVKFAGAEPPPADLWVVVYLAEDGPESGFAAGTVGGGAVWVPGGSGADRIEAQNELRESAGLRPIPDPRTLQNGWAAGESGFVGPIRPKAAEGE